MYNNEGVSRRIARRGEPSRESGESTRNCATNPELLSPPSRLDERTSLDLRAHARSYMLPPFHGFQNGGQLVAVKLRHRSSLWQLLVTPCNLATHVVIVAVAGRGERVKMSRLFKHSESPCP